ncbi:XdhC family protein [Gottfriedia acidiceleris]|uniref:XdhC family protein n=1 Tax=Gottfriedia acidiceleris TaxID=371036 RepID=A0ABY4JR47_9BACI|nr:XdhC/CoxI family protein [Gottfriedia acidiceleris]UPM56308.1 XdhC family protein [Gottfriedia acidiceleris]
MESIHEILNEITSFKEGDVLATIIHVEGTAYRKEGTSMLFKGNGKEVGLLSAGCLEADLSYRVQETRVRKTAQTVTYDMSAEDDLTWGNGAGCNGIITVLLEPIDESLFLLLTKLKRYLLNGTSVSMMKIFSDNSNEVETLFLVDEKTFFGNCNERKLVQIKSALSELHYTNQKSGLRTIELFETNMYLHTFHPKPRLFVFGAGKDAIPLVKLASLAGFFVTITDWRAELCSKENFPDAEKILVGFPSEIIPSLQLTASDSAIIITHQFQKDKEILNHILNSNLKYLGVLGGKKRIQRLLEGKKGETEINSPAGLQIGAEGPEEIAISIVGELIQRQRIKKLSKHEE